MRVVILSAVKDPAYHVCERLSPRPDPFLIVRFLASLGMTVLPK
jgi:hypothetical protein